MNKPNQWIRPVVLTVACAVVSAVTATEGVADKWAIVGGMTSGQYDWCEVDESGSAVSGGWVLRVSWDASLNRIGIVSVKTAGSAGVLDFSKTDLVSVSDSVFKTRTGITEVRFPAKFETVGNSAFYACTGLGRVDFGGAASELYSIGSGAFSGCTSLTNVVPLLPEKLRTLAGSAFCNCPVTGDLRLGYGAVYPFAPGERIFQYKHRLTSIDIGPMVTKLDNYSFCSTAENTTLKRVRLGDNITHIGNQQFDNCYAIERFENAMPKALATSGSAWRYCALPATLRYDLPTLGAERLFEKSTGLTRCIFGKKFLGTFNNQCMFNYVKSLKYVDFEGDVIPQFNTGSTFANANGAYSILVTVPSDGANWKSALADPTQVTPWSQLDAATQAKFTANFPDDPAPLGLIVANWGTQARNPNTLVNQWITTDTKGVWAQLKWNGSRFVVDVTLDTAKLSSADISVRVTDGNGQATVTPLVTGLTSSGSYALPTLAANSSYQVELMVSNGGTPYATADLGGIYAGAVSISSAGSLDVTNDGSATITVTRGTSAAATKHPLTVSLACSGTAVAGADYAAFETAIVLPAGESSATVTVAPLLNAAATEAKTLTVTLAKGGYQPASSSASVTIAAAKPDWGWTYDATAKSITQRDASGTAWVMSVDVSGTDLTLKGTKIAGSSTVVDFRKVIATADGVKYRIVSSVSDQPFKGNAKITELYLPESMTTVGSSFCNGCTALTKVRLGSKLQVLKGNAFYNCYNLVSVTPFLPETLKTLEGGVFYNCYRLTTPLRYGFGRTPTGSPLPIGGLGSQTFRLCKKIPSVEIGPGVTSVPQDSYMDCAELKTVALPENLVSIGSTAFQGCTALETVTPFLPETLIYLGGHAFCNCNALAGKLKFGQRVKVSAGEGTNGMFGNSLVSEADIDNLATLPRGFFRNLKCLTRVSIGDATTAFGPELFQDDTALTSITLPANLTSIGSSCFNGCKNLATVTPLLPASVSYIGASAFLNCQALAGELRFGLGLDAASFGGSAVFQNCYKLEKAFLGDAIPEITQDCFSSCKALTYVKLPKNLTKLSASGIFNACSSLATVEPLLPAGVGDIGGSCFNGTVIEGALYFATNGTSAVVSGNAFKGTHLSKVVFGDNVTSIGQDCFNGCKQLESVALPKNLQQFSSTGTFGGCTALKDVKPLLPETLTKDGGSVFSGCTSLNLPVRYWPAVPMEAGGQSFYSQGTKGVTEVDFGANVTKIGSQFFDGTKSVKRIVMRNQSLAFGNNSFGGWIDHYCSFVIHRDQTTWNGAALSDVMTPWGDLSSDIQKKYTDAFPGEPEPRGVIKDAKYPKRQWVVSYGIVTPGVKSLTINGVPQQFAAGQVSPAYGGNKNISVPMNVSAPRYAPEGNVLYGCAGHVLETSGDFGWENPVTNLFADADSRTIGYTTDTDGDKRLSWLWEPAAYSITVVQPTDPTIGSATVSQGSLEGYFKIGETATITAVDGSGTFVQWHGDVPAGHETDRVLSVRIDGPKNITPEFSSPWTYDATKKTITDGCWTLNATVSKDGTKYVVGVPTVVYELGILDLTKKMASGDSRVIAEIANSAFKNNQILTEVRLPDTLERIGSEAFSGCVNLKTVTPFLPPGVSYIGQQAFFGCSSLASELTLRTAGGNLELSGSSQFNGTAIPRVTFGPEVTKVSTSCFRSCGKLTEVRLNDALVEIGTEAFMDCSSLETLEPLLPATLTKLNGSAFYGCANLGGRVYIGTNGVEVTLATGGGHGAFQDAGVEEIHLGEGVFKIPAGFGRGNKRLKILTMSESVTNIDSSVFAGCSQLTTVSPLLPASLQYLGNEAFYDCPKLEGDAVIGMNGVEVTIGGGQSYGPLRGTAITSLTVGSGLRNVPNTGLCNGCGSLTNVVFADGGVTNLGNGAFYNCSALKAVKLPKDLVSIRADAFRNCSALKTVEPFLPPTIRLVERYAFGSCSSIETPLVLETPRAKGARPTIDLTADTQGNQFGGCKNVSALTIGEVSPLVNSTFSSMTAVKEVYLKGAAPLAIGGTSGNNFEFWTERQSRWHVPLSGWTSWLEKNVTPWAEVSSEDKDFYHESYPGARDPYGLLTGYQKSAKQWVVLWNPYDLGFKIIVR